MNNSERKYHSPEQKVSILRRHPIEKVPVSNLCEEFGLDPTAFYCWLEQFIEHGAATFQNHRPDSSRQRDQERIDALELKMASSKFYSSGQRYGRVNKHNAWFSRDLWLEPGEKHAISDFQGHFPLEGDRCLTFMILDRNDVAVSPASVWRVLHYAGRLSLENAPRRRAAASRSRGLLMSIDMWMSRT